MQSPLHSGSQKTANLADVALALEKLSEVTQEAAEDKHYVFDKDGNKVLL